MYAIWELDVANYHVNHILQNIDGSYPAPISSQTFSDVIGKKVTPGVNTYEGFTSPAAQDLIITADGQATVNYYYTRNSYDVTFIDIGSKGLVSTEFGRTVEKRVYGASVDGGEIGNSTADNAYYPNYKLNNTTSATVTTSGAVVYRYFGWITTEITGTVEWIDGFNVHATRPNEVKLQLFQNGQKAPERTDFQPQASANFKSTYIGLTNNANCEYPLFSDTAIGCSYIFSALPKYDANGVAYIYEVRQGDVDEDIKYTSNSHATSMKNPEDEYVTTQNGFNIHNKLDNTDEDEDISEGFVATGAIHWSDSGNRLGYRPDTVEIALYQDGQPFIRNGEHYKLEIDATDENIYTFIKLPKYKYVDGKPVLYKYSAVETVSSIYVENGAIKPAYDIHVDEEFGSYKPLHFTNYFNTTDKPLIPVVPNRDNTIHVKTNTEERVDVKFKMLEWYATGTYDNINRVDGPDYNGNEFNASVNELGETLKHMPSGKYEIEVNEELFELKDIKISDNTSNVSITYENGKYYLVIGDTQNDSEGTVNITLEKRPQYYQSRMHINNYFTCGWDMANGIMEMMVISAETDEVSAELPSFIILYEDIEDGPYTLGDTAIIKDYEGDLDQEFVGWEDKDGNMFLPGDEILEGASLKPVFLEDTTEYHPIG